MDEGDRFERTWGWDSRGFRGRADGRRFAFRIRRLSEDGYLDDIDAFLAPAPGAAPEHCRLSHLHVYLSEVASGPAARAAVHVLTGEFLPEGLFALFAAHPGLESRHGTYYALDRDRREARIAAALAHPALARILPEASIDAFGLDDEPPGISAREILARRAPAALPGSIRAILRRRRPIRSLGVLDALLALPPERHPATEADHEAFETIVGATEAISALLGDYGYLRGFGPEWSDQADRLGQRIDFPPERPHPRPDGTPGHVGRWRGLEDVSRDVRDVAKAFSRQLLVPALHARGAGPESRLMRAGGLDGRWPDGNAPATLAAARLLFAGKSLPAILELSAEWHARRNALEARLAAIARPAGGTEVPVPEGTWRIPIGPVAAPNGVEIVFLADPAALLAEGADIERGGLAHCVGGYDAACASGRSAIASLRDARGGVPRRLSTAELAFEDGGVRVVQHRGPRNAQPPAAARKALAWFEGEIDAQRIRPSADYLSATWRKGAVAGNIPGACGYDHLSPGALDAAVAAWSPFLTRPLRDPDALALAGTAPTFDLEAERIVRDRQPRRRVSWKPLRDVAESLLFPLRAGETLADEAAGQFPFLHAPTVALVVAAAIEAALFVAIYGVLGPRWLGFFILQATAFVWALARIMAGRPSAFVRTLGHWAWARRGGERFPDQRSGGALSARQA